MSWNNAYERKKFEARQKKLKEEYRLLGMTDEQIEELYEFDLQQFRSDRRYRSHTQSFLPGDFDENEDDDEKLSIFDKFKDVLTTTIEDEGYKSREWWIEELDRSLLVQRIKLLSRDDLELLVLSAIDGYTQAELASIYGIAQKNISKKLKRIKNFLSEGV